MTADENSLVENAPPPTQSDVQELIGSVYEMTALITEVLAPGLDQVRVDLDKTKRDKVSREESQQRAHRSIALVMTAVLIAIVLNTLFVVGVIVPKCYNGTAGRTHACNLIPGYATAARRNNELLAQFRQNQQDLKDEVTSTGQRQQINQRRLDQLERDDALLRKRLGLPPAPQSPQLPPG